MIAAAKIFSILFCAFSLVPAGAHLMELANKIGASREEYLTMQQIYHGWQLSGILVIGALLSTLALTWLLRKQRGFVAALTAFLCIVGTQVVFWSFTFPVNIATDNWTVLPTNWEALRAQWEYSHATSAVLNIAALVAATIAGIPRNATYVAPTPPHGKRSSANR